MKNTKIKTCKNCPDFENCYPERDSINCCGLGNYAYRVESQDFIFGNYNNAGDAEEHLTELQEDNPEGQYFILVWDEGQQEYR